jgi:hypothetical protein
MVGLLANMLVDVNRVSADTVFQPDAVALGQFLLSLRWGEVFHVGHYLVDFVCTTELNSAPC